MVRVPGARLSLGRGKCILQGGMLIHMTSLILYWNFWTTTKHPGFPRIRTLSKFLDAWKSKMIIWALPYGLGCCCSGTAEQLLRDLLFKVNLWSTGAKLWILSSWQGSWVTYRCHVWFLSCHLASSAAVHCRNLSSGNGKAYVHAGTCPRIKYVCWYLTGILAAAEQVSYENVSVLIME